MKKKLISFVIPAKDEENSVGRLYSEIVQVVSKLNVDYEVIFIDDGSVDQTLKVLQDLRSKDNHLKIIKERGNWGKSIALQTGFDHAVGDVIITMDADLQDNPEDIPNFLKKIDEGFDLVVGWKKKRLDPAKIVIPSRIFNNFLIPALTGIKLHDNNCGFKAFRKEVAQSLSLYGELFRFIPVLVAKQNFRVGEIQVSHRKRIYGKTKFGWQKNIKGFLDLATIVFLTGYIRRPGHFFGGAGMLSFFFGFVIGAYIAYLRITTGTIQNHQPLLILGLLLMIIGIQLTTTGLMAEMLTHFNQRKSQYDKYIEKIEL